MQVTTYSVSDSVNCIGLVDDLKSGPKAAISGTEASCSVKKNLTKISNINFFSCIDGKYVNVSFGFPIKFALTLSEFF